jgi:hypothetical protein
MVDINEELEAAKTAEGQSPKPFAYLKYWNRAALRIVA